MELAKPDICSLPPFNMVVTTNYANVGDATQSSVFVEKKIEEFTTEFRTGKKLTNRASGIITDRVHNQRQTNLCASFAGTTTIRGAAKRFLLSNGITLQHISDDLEAVQGVFTFNKMLTLLTGCVSPRSLDGLLVNSQNDQKFISAQFQTISNVKNRLVWKTALEDEGWKRILSISKLFEKYNLNPDRIELESTEVYHPRIPGNHVTFSDALRQNKVIFTMIFNDTVSPLATNQTYPAHAVVIFGENQNQFLIKNSYFNEKEIQIDSRLPIYGELVNNKNRFCGNARQIDPHFDDQNYIFFNTGFAFEFKDKAP